MAKYSINASLVFAALVVCLMAERSQAKLNANNKLSHKRSDSQVEEVFRRLPSIENEVDSFFDDASFLSSFGASPNAEKDSEKEIEDLFRRILISEKNQKNRKLSFLSDNLAAAGVSPTVLEESEDVEPTKFSDFMSNMNFKQLDEGPTVDSMSSISAISPVESAGAIKPNIGAVRPAGPVGSVVPATLTSNKVGDFTFNFPTIQHTVFSGPIHLKAHSNMDLTPLDPEIFDVVQSILTPYLQLTIGETLHAYNLEIDYAPSADEGVDEGSVVTLMEVKCIFKVISDSIEDLRSTDHDLAKKWVVDFFTGPERYNIIKLIEALQQNSIPIDDIVFVNQEFKMDNIVVSQANTESFGNNRANKIIENLPSNTAMVAVTLSVLIAGLLFFMHYTGRLPSKKETGEISRNTRNLIRKYRMKQGDDADKNGGRRRTFSGTFRRFPTGGLQKAKIQKKPAKSKHYIGDSESASNKLSAYGDDYSFSHYGGDYGPPATPSRHSSMPPMTPLSRRSGDEFSMPDNYDSVHERSGHESLRGKAAKAANYLMSPKQKRSNYSSTKSPIPSRAPRRVTANDIASPHDDVDNWSIDSYESSVESPSEHGLYRDFPGAGTEMRRPVPASDPPASNHRREKLSLPFFS